MLRHLARINAGLALVLSLMFVCLPAWAEDTAAALIASAQSGDTVAIGKLLSQGVDPNTHEDETGISALEWAAAKGHLAAVKALLKAHADVDGAYNSMEYTPLMRAANYGFRDVATLLIAKGANVNAQTSDDETPLYFAVSSNHPKVVALLVTKGADVNARTSKGATPLDAAVSNKHLDVAALLKSHGAKRGDQIYAAALKKWRPLAARGDAAAQFNLGVMYDNGQGVTQDHQQAAAWYRKADEQGYAQAQYSLGQAAYDHKDYQTALKLWLPLANRGEMRAQLAVGYIYYNGAGVKQSYARALKWLRKAADQGSPEAQDGIGWQYETGHGVDQDTDEGRRWFLRSANQGDFDGMNHMAESYMGEGNEPEIYFWYSLLARPPGSNFVEFRDSEAGRITADQKAAVDKRLEDWKPVPERP